MKNLFFSLLVVLSATAAQATPNYYGVAPAWELTPYFYTYDNNYLIVNVFDRSSSQTWKHCLLEADKDQSVLNADVRRYYKPSEAGPWETTRPTLTVIAEVHQDSAKAKFYGLTCSALVYQR